MGFLAVQLNNQSLYPQRTFVYINRDRHGIGYLGLNCGWHKNDDRLFADRIAALVVAPASPGFGAGSFLERRHVAKRNTGPSRFNVVLEQKVVQLMRRMAKRRQMCGAVKFGDRGELRANRVPLICAVANNLDFDRLAHGCFGGKSEELMERLFKSVYRWRSD